MTALEQAEGRDNVDANAEMPFGFNMVFAEIFWYANFSSIIRFAVKVLYLIRIELPLHGQIKLSNWG